MVNRWRMVIVAALVGAVIAGIASWWVDRQDSLVRSGPAATPGRPGELQVLEKRPAAPDVPFADGDNAEVTLAAFRGKGVVLNLWATWCPPCIKEMPSLDRLSQAMGQSGVVVIALSEDPRAELPRKFLAGNGYTHLPVHLDERGKLSRALGATGLPTTYIIDTEGRIAATLQGPAEWDSDAMKKQVLSLVRPTN